MTRTLITGAGGFVGRIAVPMSAELGPVRGITRRPVDGDADLAHWDGSEDHLVELFAAFDPTRVLHLATDYQRSHGVADIRTMVDANVAYPAMVLEAAVRTTQPTVVLAHTGFQHYGEPNRALNLYAATKLAAAEIARYYADAHRVRWTAVSLYDVYGPDPKPGTLIARAVDATRGGPPLAVPARDLPIGLIYVDDAVRALHAAATAVEAGTADVGSEFFAVPVEFLSISEIVATVEAVTGSTVARADEPYPVPERAITDHVVGPIPPGWKATVDLSEGIRRILAS